MTNPTTYFPSFPLPPPVMCSRELSPWFPQAPVPDSNGCFAIPGSSLIVGCECPLHQAGIYTVTRITFVFGHFVEYRTNHAARACPWQLLCWLSNMQWHGRSLLVHAYGCLNAHTFQRWKSGRCDCFIPQLKHSSRFRGWSQCASGANFISHPCCQHRPGIGWIRQAA